MNKNSSKIRFNFIDVIILLAIVAVIAAVVWMALLQRNPVSSDSTVHVEYTVRLTYVREEFADSIKNGDIVQNSSTGNNIGMVVEVKHPTHTKFYNTSNIVKQGETSTVTVSEYEDYYDIYVTISATATMGENGVAYVDGNKILIGSPVNFRISPFASQSYITAFTITEK